jgi:hypothetical protein
MGDTAPVQLRANDERAVLVGHDGMAEQEVDAGSLPLGGQLSEDLCEWARVVGAVRRSEPAGAGMAGAVVSRRGRQLAARVAASLHLPVAYIDPMTGEVSVIDPPSGRPAAPTRPTLVTREPTPWLTGLTVSAFVLVVVLVSMLTLIDTLARTHPVLAVGTNVVVTAGLMPSVWLVRHTPIWRWVALGVFAAISLAWLALPFLLL